HSTPSCSVCFGSGDVITWIEGASRATAPISPDAFVSMSAVMPTLKRENDVSATSNRLLLPYTHHRIGDTAVVIRSLLPQYFVRTAATCSRLIMRTVFASSVSFASCSQLAPGPP